MFAGLPNTIPGFLKTGKKRRLRLPRPWGRGNAGTALVFLIRPWSPITSHMSHQMKRPPAAPADPLCQVCYDQPDGARGRSQDVCALVGLLFRSTERRVCPRLKLLVARRRLPRPCGGEGRGEGAPTVRGHQPNTTIVLQYGTSAAVRQWGRALIGYLLFHVLEGGQAGETPGRASRSARQTIGDNI